MKILVTGGTGFIGAAFIRTARAAGHEILALTRQPRADEEGICWLTGTLAEPPWPQIAQAAPDVCLHAAWIAEPGVYLESPLNEHYVQWSYDFLRRAAELEIGYALGLGTCIEYAVEGTPMHEERTPLAPFYPYARCKDALRRRVEAERLASGAFRFGWGRVFYPYGPGEHPARLCTALARKLIAGETLLLKTPDSTKDYVFIDDLSAAILAVLERRLPGAVNLGTGAGAPVRDIARVLGRILGREELIDESDPPALDPLYFVVADATRLHRETGWRPAHSLSAGLHALVASLPV